MATQVHLVPFGTPWANLVGQPNQAHGHFSPSLTVGGHDTAPLIAANANISAGDLSSDDTSSYAHVDHAGYDADLRSTFGEDVGPDPYWLYTTAEQDAAYVPPGDPWALTSVYVVVVAKPAGADHRLRADLYGDGYGRTGTTAVLPTGTWTRATVGQSSRDHAALMAALATRSMFIQLFPSSLTTRAGISTDLAYLAVQLTWDNGVTRHRVPHLRGFQRGCDGQGITGGKRGRALKSRQSSNRRGPGSFY